MAHNAEEGEDEDLPKQKIIEGESMETIRCSFDCCHGRICWRICDDLTKMEKMEAEKERRERKVVSRKEERIGN